MIHWTRLIGQTSLLNIVFLKQLSLVAVVCTKGDICSPTPLVLSSEDLGEIEDKRKVRQGKWELGSPTPRNLWNPMDHSPTGDVHETHENKCKYNSFHSLPWSWKKMIRNPLYHWVHCCYEIWIHSDSDMLSSCWNSCSQSIKVFKLVICSNWVKRRLF